MYVITGATGNIGSKAVDLLLDRGEKVRVIGRDASRLQRFVDKGAEAATGNLKDWGFLSRAFTGATTVFSMIPPNYTAADFRAYQNEIGTSIANALKNSGVSHVVNLSSQGAEFSEGTGPIKGLHDQEERLNGISGLHVLHLRPTYFMENLLMNIPVLSKTSLSFYKKAFEFNMLLRKSLPPSLNEVKKSCSDTSGESSLCQCRESRGSSFGSAPSSPKLRSNRSFSVCPKSSRTAIPT
jgi:hypothetical protein